jgi:hypothetical protein
MYGMYYSVEASLFGVTRKLRTVHLAHGLLVEPFVGIKARQVSIVMMVELTVD